MREERDRKREDTNRESGDQVRHTLDVVPSDFEFEEERGTRQHATGCRGRRLYESGINRALIEPQ